MLIFPGVKASDPIQSRGEKHGGDKGDIECWSSTASLNGKTEKKIQERDDLQDLDHNKVLLRPLRSG